MPVDTSFYPKPQAPANPLETLTSVMGLQRAGLQNQILQRTMGAQQAVGQAYQHNTGPDGSLDTAGAAQEIAGDPNAAYAAQEASERLQAQHVQQVGLAIQQQQQVNTAITSILSDAVGPNGLPDPNKIRPENISGRIQELVANGILPAKTAASEIGSIPTDPGQRLGWLKQHLFMGMSSIEQLGKAYPEAMAINRGPEVVFQRNSPMGDTPAPIQNGLSPESAAQPVAGPTTPEGAPTTVPLAQRAGMGVVQTGPSPGQQAAASQYGAQTAGRASDFEAATAKVPEQVAALQNLRSVAQQIRTGKGAEALNTFKGRLNTVIPGLFDNNGVAHMEEAEKYAAQTALQAGVSGTDAKLAQSIISNPNVHVSPQALEHLIGTSLGQLRYQQAMGKEWQAAKGAGASAGDFSGFQSAFQNHVSPLAFQFMEMAPSARSEMVKTLSAAERTKLNAEVAAGKRAGYWK